MEPMKRILLTILVYISAHNKCTCVRSATTEEHLMRFLFKDYDTDARPVLTSNKTVVVKVQFALMRIQRLDETHQILFTTGLLLTDWQDERLTWNPEDFQNITDIVVKSDRVWTPDLAITNGAEAHMITDVEKIRVLITYNGMVHWEPGGIFSTTCDIDITFFPFDTQACKIEIGAWAHMSSRMNLSNTDVTMDIHDLKTNGQWDIVSTAAEWMEDVIIDSEKNIFYSKVLFIINIRRRYTFYILNIILPCTLLSTLVLAVFCVPPDAGEKISAGISVLLAFTVFLLMLADNVPRTSLHVPILIIYLTCTMSLATISVCLTIAVLNIHHMGGSRPLPHWIRSVLLLKCSRIFLLPGVYHSVLQQNYYLQKDTPATDLNKERCDRPDHNKRLQSKIQTQHSIRISETHKFADALLNEDVKHDNENIGSCISGEAGASQNHCNDQEPMSTKEERTAKEWQMVARVLDRIFFSIVFVLMFASASLVIFSPSYAKYHSASQEA